VSDGWRQPMILPVGKLWEHLSASRCTSGLADQVGDLLGSSEVRTRLLTVQRLPHLGQGQAWPDLATGP
jgi:hypothetical protein